MALVEILMPRMGESIMEGTILKWLKDVGDTLEEEDSLLEVATDKIDTEIPTPYPGVLKELLVKEGDVIQVDRPIAIIDTNALTESNTSPKNEATVSEKQEPVQETTAPQPAFHSPIEPTSQKTRATISSDRFYSPLVLNIARKENLPLQELDTIPGSGKEGRVTKNDILEHLKQRKVNGNVSPTSDTIKQGGIAFQKPIHEEPSSPAPENKSETVNHTSPTPVSSPAKSVSGEHEIIEMDRMRKVIAERMLESKRTSPHVTSFVEADVTNIVYWRNRMKNLFKEKENTILTYTPIFIEATIKALKEYPMMNISVDGDKIIKKKEINIGIAVALQNGNLVVPVIHNADQLNLVGLTKKVNDLAKRARNNQLTADDLTGGTYTISNMGSFGNVLGTPIIVQPQVGIMALGAIVKKPAIVESVNGDTIGIRHMMFLSHSYDHRVVDGALGGMFVRRLADHLERFDLDRKIFD